jgi:hypothetical protein
MFAFAVLDVSVYSVQASPAVPAPLRETNAMRHALIALLLVCLPACGGDDGPPTQPTSETLTISPATDFLTIGQTETFTATVRLSNGQTQSVSATWQSDNSSVASIDSSGRVTGLRNGTATISASHEGLVDDRLIRVAPDYAGTWVGDYAVRACSATGDIRSSGFCSADGFRVGEILPIAFEFTQTRDQVTGQMFLGQIEGTATGGLNAEGRFDGTATLSFVAEGAVVSFDVDLLRLRADGSRLTGNFALDVTAAGASGTGHLEGQLRTVVRTTTASPTGAAERVFPDLRTLWQAARGRR